MSESLSDRLKRLSEEDAKQQRTEIDATKFQEQVNKFISEHSRPEYDRLLAIIKGRVEEINPEIGDLPKFQLAQNGQEIIQGNATAYLNFDKPILNLPNNALLISFAPHRNAMYFIDEPPAPERYRLQAAASNSLDAINWVGDLGELKSEKLADFIIEQLTRYYLAHKPK